MHAEQYSSDPKAKAGTVEFIAFSLYIFLIFVKNTKYHNYSANLVFCIFSDVHVFMGEK